MPQGEAIAERYAKENANLVARSTGELNEVGALCPLITPHGASILMHMAGLCFRLHSVRPHHDHHDCVSDHIC